MSIAYVIENYIDVDTLDSVSSQISPFYEMYNIYNTRPSLPLRFEGKGSAGNPEWICIDMGVGSGSTPHITFVGVFNHNLTTSPERFALKGCADGCESLGSGGCDWEAAPAWTIDLRDRILSDGICSDKYTNIFENSCKKIDVTSQYYRLEFIDTANPDEYVEAGEVVLSEWCKFGKNVHLQPGRADGPMFFMGNQKTYYGQDWAAYYSYAEHFTLTFKNINDVNNRDELQLFLIRVQQNGGKFIIIPDDASDCYQAGYMARCYYVIIENQSDYAQRLAHGWTRELREWTIELKTLTSGIKLL